MAGAADRLSPARQRARTLNAGYQIHAAIDVSDGLSLDLNHIAQQSNCGAVLDVASIPISDAALELARQHDGDALEHALSDGEDFELILVVPSDEAKRLIDQQPLDVPLTRIGYFIDEPGLWQTTAGSDPVRLAPAGFQHLLDS